MSEYQGGKPLSRLGLPCASPREDGNRRPLQRAWSKRWTWVCRRVWGHTAPSEGPSPAWRSCLTAPQYSGVLACTVLARSWVTPGAEMSQVIPDHTLVCAVPFSWDGTPTRRRHGHAYPSEIPLVKPLCPCGAEFPLLLTPDCASAVRFPDSGAPEQKPWPAMGGG